MVWEEHEIKPRGMVTMALGLPLFHLIVGIVTLWLFNIANWKITIFNGTIHNKWPCSIAMLNYQRVIWRLHQSLLQQQPRSHILARGSEASGKQLAELLTTKGVPESKAQERAQMVLGKIGLQQIQHILKSKNPWAQLKAAASQPGHLFRLITVEEQNNYVNSRARSKHGAQVQNHKNFESEGASFPRGCEESSDSSGPAEDLDFEDP